MKNLWYLILANEQAHQNQNIWRLQTRNFLYLKSKLKNKTQAFIISGKTLPYCHCFI